MLRNDWRTELGRMGEIGMAQWLRAARWFVMPARNDGPDDPRAPAYRDERRFLVAPDFDAFKLLLRLYLEIKTKTAFSLYRWTNQPQHGIDLPKYFHYVEIERNSGTPVWLIVLERHNCDERVFKDGLAKPSQLNNWTIYGQALAVLGPGRDDDSRKNSGPMMYWDRRQFIRLGALWNPARELELEHLDLAARKRGRP